MPDTMQPAPLQSVYQLSVVVRGVSPLIWRRLLVRADTTIAGLHSVGRTLTCIGSSSRVASTASATSAVSASATIPTRFMSPTWDYGRPNGSSTTTTSPTAGAWTCVWSKSWSWIPAGSTRAAPVAVGPGPPEASGGVRAFLEQTQPNNVLAATLRAVEILSLLLEAEDLTRFGEHRDELAGLLPLLVVDQFDRRTLNRALAALSATGSRAA